MALNHEEKVIIYTMGVLEELQKNKTISGGRIRLDENGMEIYHQLKAKNFRPTEEEMQHVIALIQNPPEEIKKKFIRHGKIKYNVPIISWLCNNIKKLLKK